MYKYVIEEYFKGFWLFFRGFDDLEFAHEFLDIIHKKHPNSRYRLINVITEVIRSV